MKRDAQNPYGPRLEALREKLRAERLDALLIRSRANIFYLSGYPAGEAYALVTPEEGHLIVDFIYEEEAVKTCRTLKVARVQDSTAKTLARLVRRLGLLRVGVESDQIYWNIVRAFRRETGPGVRWVPKPRMVESLRAVKDADEIAAVRASVRLMEKGLAWFAAERKAGRCERDLQRALETRLFDLGAQAMAFDLIVASGPSASQPHARPGKRPAKAGSPLLVDAGTRLREYCSDLTRTFILHRIDSSFERAYRTVLEAQELALRAVRPGLRIADLDGVAREHIRAKGLGKRFGHSLGHGVGLEVHEEPRIAATVRGRLQPGMIITIEPGVYLPGRMGIRIEDMVLVTPGGHEVLSRFPKSIESMVTR